MKTVKEMQEEIATRVQKELDEQFPDITVTKSELVACYEGLQEGWKEDPDESTEKSFYMLALSLLIIKTKTAIYTESLKST